MEPSRARPGWLVCLALSFCQRNCLTNIAFFETNLVHPLTEESGSFRDTMTKKVSGEVESQWKPEAVEGNFERLLKNSGNSGKYLLKADGRAVELDVDIFAYRDGSMVEYEFPYSYKAKGDGSVTYSQAEIDALIDRIEEVAAN